MEQINFSVTLNGLNGPVIPLSLPLNGQTNVLVWWVVGGGGERTCSLPVSAFV